MTTCLGESCSFSLMCVSFVNVYQSVCVLLSLWSCVGMWDLSFYFALDKIFITVGKFIYNKQDLFIQIETA